MRSEAGGADRANEGGGRGDEKGNEVSVKYKGLRMGYSMRSPFGRSKLETHKQREQITVLLSPGDQSSEVAPDCGQACGHDNISRKQIVRKVTKIKKTA